MSATKAQLDQILSASTGVALANVAQVTSALPDALGKWMKENGSVAPGTFSGDASGIKLEMTRAASPSPHWKLDVDGSPAFLDDYGDGSGRFGLPVQNA